MSSAHDVELRKEASVMALHVAVCLLAALTASGEDADHGHVRAFGLVWGTTIGLAVAHAFAFRPSAANRLRSLIAAIVVVVVMATAIAVIKNVLSGHGVRRVDRGDVEPFPRSLPAAEQMSGHPQSVATPSAAQISPIRMPLSVPRRSTSTPTETGSTKSRLTAHLRGRFDDAEEWFRQAESVHDALDSPPLRAYNDVAWASMLADRRVDDDVERARTLAERGLAAARDSGFTGLAAEATLVLTRC
jgi:hypothetical protein